MTKKLFYFAILITTLVCSQTTFADVKVKSKQTMSGQTYENTTYIKGKRQRTETMNGMMINITQCDLRRGVQVNPSSKTYVVNPFATTTETVTKPAVSGVEKIGVVQAGGTVTTTITTKDTGERKQMFSYTARHLIITMETISSADACNNTKSKMETDGWYIDFEPQFDCDYSQGYGGYNSYQKGGCKDKYQMKTIGTAKRGYPVYEKMTMFDDNGKETMTMLNEVVELSKATLDAGLFDVPADYREVSDASQMYASMSGSTTTSTSSSSGRASTMTLPNSGPSANVLGNTLTPSPNGSSATGPKQAGTIRIGLAGVKTGAVGEGLTASDLSAAVQNTLVNYLRVPNIEVVTLDAKLPVAIDGEARQKECDYVIYATASHKKGGGGFGMFGSALGSAIGRTGIGHTGSTAGNIAGQVATQTVVSATSLSANVKSKDEITLDLKLARIGGESAFAKVYKAKAKSNGDDIISAVIEQAAQAIVDTVGK